MEKQYTYEEHYERFYKPAIAAIKEKIKDCEISESVSYNFIENKWIKNFTARDGENVVTSIALLHHTELSIASKQS